MKRGRKIEGGGGGGQTCLRLVIHISDGGGDLVQIAFA